MSFSIDDPSQLTEELDLSSLISIRSAACDGENYYLVTSEDGILPNALVTVNIKSKKLTTVKTYDYQKDLIGSFVILDMDYNPANKKLYAMGFNMETAEFVDGSIEFSSIALFTIDTANGDVEIIGEQDKIVFTAITFSKDGDLFGIDGSGDLWTISAYNGRPLDNLYSTGISPVGQQSMTTDTNTGSMYWASCSQNGDNGMSKFIQIDHTDDWVFSTKDLGELSDATELVGLYIDPDPISNDAPADPTDLTVTPAAEGGNTALIEWINPTATRDGKTLENVDAVVYVDGTAVQTLSGEKAGSKSSYTYTATKSGLLTVSVSAIANGEEGSAAYADAVFVGTDRPGAVVNLEAKRLDPDKYDITVSWEKPATGAQGGWYDASQLTYRIVRMPDDKVIAEAATYTSFTDSEISTTAAYIYEITPSTAAGAGLTTKSIPCISGPAIQPPYTMDLRDQADANMWTVVNGDNDEYLWSILENWGGTDTSYRYYPETNVGGTIVTDDWLISPSIELKAGKYYSLAYDVRLWGVLFPATYVVAMGHGVDPANLTTVLARYDADDSVDLAWERRGMTFTVDADGSYNFGFGVLLANPVEIKGFEIREIDKIDIAATELSGSTSTGVGFTSTYTVTVTNMGYESIDKFEVSLVDGDGTVLVSRQIDETLAPQESATYDLVWTPSAGGTFDIHAIATTADDSNTDNDASNTITVSVLLTGKWHDITDGTSLSGYSPFYMQYLYSGAQTIYTASELGGTPSTISGITYYYYIMGGAAPAPFEVKIAMANTSISGFDTNLPLDQGEFTTVYEGTLTIDASKKSFTIMFDTPFEYTGGNLCIQSEHSSTSTASLLFYSNTKGENSVTALYRSDEAPYDYTQNAGVFKDRPNVSLFMSQTSAITDVKADNKGISYNSATHTLTLDTEDTVSVYSLQGVLLFRGRGITFDLSTLSGPAIITAAGKALKVIL